MAHLSIDKEMKSAVKEVSNCHMVCLETIGYCLEMGGDYADKDHMVIMMNCAETCGLAKKSMVHMSPVHRIICDVCADVCEACADSCNTLPGKEMSRCAEACRKCAAACRAMADMI